MEELIANQAVIRTHIAGHYANFLKKGTANVSVELTRKRITRLQQLWQQLLENDRLIREDPDVDTGSDYFREDFYTQHKMISMTHFAAMRFTSIHTP